MSHDQIRITPMDDRPLGYAEDAIDEIIAADAGITLRQIGKHTIFLDIRVRAGTQHFRFDSTTPGKGTGICLQNSQETPPGSQTATPGYPGEIAAYNLRQGQIHIEMMDVNRFWIGITAGSRGGSMDVITRGRRGGNIILRPHTMTA